MAMTHATKMALVPQEMLERFQQYPDPSPATKATLALDTEMKKQFLIEMTSLKTKRLSYIITL